MGMSSKRVTPVATTLTFPKFWTWLQGHVNCIVRAGTPEVVLFDHDDFHWTLLAEDDTTRVVQLARGKELVGELVLFPTEIAYVQTEPGEQEGEFLFDCMIETESAREVAYHGTTLGALSATGITELRSQFEPLAPGGCHVPNTNLYRHPDDRDPMSLAEAIDERICFEGPETVAAVILEPVQNAGGCFVPPDGYFQRVREICDEHDVLLISDEVICAWGRLGHFFACDRFGYQPDIITTAKALTSANVPMGAMIASDKLAEPFEEGNNSFAHGFTFAGHPVAAAVALANIELYEKEDLCGHVLAKEGEFRAMLETLRDIPIVGDVRGAGFFQAIELVKDQGTKETFEGMEAENLLRGFLSQELYKRGLICRADDRGDPVIQLAPPLICDTEQFQEMHDVLRPVLEEASTRMVN